MDLRRYPCIVESAGVKRAIADVIDRIVPSLQEECWRSQFADVNVRIECSSVSTQMTWIQGNGKVGPAAEFVRFIDGLVRGVKDIARLDNEEAACRKADDAHLLWIDLQLLCPGTN